MEHALTDPREIARAIEGRNEHLIIHNLEEHHKSNPDRFALQKQICYRAGAAIPMTASLFEQVLSNLRDHDDGRSRKYTYTVHLSASVTVVLNKRAETFSEIRAAAELLDVDRWDVDDYDLLDVEVVA